MSDEAQDNARLVFSEATADRPAAVAVVAEIGVNHDGDPGLAKRLIDAAGEAGADAVKFQYFRADRLLSNQAELAGYQAGQAASQQALLKGLELGIDALRGLVEHAQAGGLAAVVTPFSLGDVVELAGLGLDGVKTASPDAVNTPLLRACAGLGLPMLVSTGTCDLAELGPAAELLRGHAAGGALLHCVSSYPTPLASAQLGGVGALAGALNLPVGYSDHTPDIATGGLAVLAGAVVIEKHLTHDPDAPGPDHAVSLSPTQMRAYVEHVRRMQAVLGPCRKAVGEIERDVRRVSRQSVCAARDLPAGHVLGIADLTLMRPGTGVPAAELEATVGRRLTRSVSAGDVLMPGNLA